MPILQGRKSAFRRGLDTLTGESIPLQHIRRKIQGKQKKTINQQSKFSANRLLGKDRNAKF